MIPFEISKLAEALERRIENGRSLFFGQRQKFIQFISPFMKNNRFGYLEYSTNNRIGQEVGSIIQKFPFYIVRPTKISLESAGVFKSAVV